MRLGKGKLLRGNRKERQRHGLLGEPSAGQSGQRLDGTEVARYFFLSVFLIYEVDLCRKYNKELVIH